ncbi:unnamed protein product [Protopolystoma xenopodis]|uniref:Uncharacterized protein n=1 Tax=Protopolystoma xenopodis TaxID=117903 RepID=A0A3S5AAQ0_9PLAT|nr:unnamed protein product [Protopolystoma xenopodis]
MQPRDSGDCSSGPGGAPHSVAATATTRKTIWPKYLRWLHHSQTSGRPDLDCAKVGTVRQRDPPLGQSRLLLPIRSFVVIGHDPRHRALCHWVPLRRRKKSWTREDWIGARTRRSEVRRDQEESPVNWAD